MLYSDDILGTQRLTQDREYLTLMVREDHMKHVQKALDYFANKYDITVDSVEYMSMV